ncbi:MAG: protein jag [Clostridia bacterium]|nr:protein jag [Clostridia bacterium]MBQ7846138.1 protein jag [Clostridia bacterium]
MKTYESSAKTIEEAISAGLETLGVSISDVTVDIIDEGSKGLFGLFGSRLAKVRLTVKEQEEDLLASLTEEKPAKKPAKKPAEKKEKAEPKQEKPKAEKSEKPAEKKPAPEKKEKAPKQPKQEKPKAEKAEKPAAEKKPLPPKAPAKPIEKPVVTMLENDQVVADSAAGKAQAFLKELTHLMGVEVDVAVGNDAEGNVFVKMTGDTLGILIGRRGETLDALQYLTSLKINRGQEGYTRVTLDTENYRAKREDTLIRLANRMANRAVKTGRKVSLEPMNPYERRIIHSALQANEAVDTHSEGDEPNRHVVITLRK